MKKGKPKWEKIIRIIELVGAFLSGVLIMFFRNVGVFEQVYNAWFREPNMTYVVEGEYEVFKNSFELKDGLMILHPQLVVQTGNNIVRIISLEGLYADNAINYSTDIAGFVTEKGDWEKVDNLASVIYIELEKEMGGEQAKMIEMKNVILLKVNYHNKDADTKKTEYYKVEDNMVDILTPAEIEAGVYEYEVNIKDITDWNSSVEVTAIVEDCVAGLNKCLEREVMKTCGD